MAFHRKRVRKGIFITTSDMYIPTLFKESRPEVLESFIAKHAFATLLTSSEKGIEGSHLPFIYYSERGIHGHLVGHMAKGNQQWKQLESSDEVLVIFQGPHCYISPTWYKSELAPPTWNYAVVHVYGKPRVVVEEPALREILEKLVSTYESQQNRPWSIPWHDKRYRDMLNAIVGFEILVTRIEGKFKLSQNRPNADQQNVIDVLTNSIIDAEQKVGNLMMRIRDNNAL